MVSNKQGQVKIENSCNKVRRSSEFTEQIVQHISSE